MPTHEITTIAGLRSAWEPLNETHRGGNRYSSGVHLRIYRCLSWAQRAADLKPTEDADLVLILHIIAFNSLWGRHYEPDQARTGEHETWSKFLVAIARFDEKSNERISRLLTEESELFQSICDSPFFHREFWVEPGAASLEENREIAERIRQRLETGRTHSLLWEFSRRMLLLRGQVIHGNATLGGSLNRDTVEAAGSALELLLRTVLEVIILDGAHEHDLEWNPVPYDPGREIPSQEG